MNALKTSFLLLLASFHCLTFAEKPPENFFDQFDRCDSLLVYPFELEPTLDEQSLKESFLALATTPANKKEEGKILLKVDQLAERLNLHVFGQSKAVKDTADAVLRFAAGINDPNTPIATMLYCGPSGVGKTELAKQLGLELYGDLGRMLRIDMSEFSEPHSISRLIGSPPGYVGYGEGGMLTNFIAKNPYSIILIDEAEKAHDKILKIFLHVFDNGIITASTGKVVDCRKAIFILTSNLAAVDIADMCNEGLTDTEILEILKPTFMNRLSPELFNRLDTIIFSPLAPEIMQKLVNKLLFALSERVFNVKKVKLLFDDSLVDYFVSFGLDPKLGARPLKRLVDKQLGTIIAKALIDGKYTKDVQLKCYYHEGMIFVQKN